MKRRLQPEARREEILNAAVKLAAEKGYTTVTRDAIAEAASVSTGLVTRYFGTMNSLRRDVMRHAIRDGVLPIVAQGLACRDPHALKAPQELKDQAVRLLVA